MRLLSLIGFGCVCCGCFLPSSRGADSGSNAAPAGRAGVAPDAAADSAVMREMEKLFPIRMREAGASGERVAQAERFLDSCEGRWDGEVKTEGGAEVANYPACRVTEQAESLRGPQGGRFLRVRSTMHFPAGDAVWTSYQAVLQDGTILSRMQMPNGRHSYDAVFLVDGVAYRVPFDRFCLFPRTDAARLKAAETVDCTVIRRSGGAEESVQEGVMLNRLWDEQGEPMVVKMRFRLSRRARR